MADSSLTTPDKGAESEGLRPDTLKFLQEVVTASYKEQADLDESVWRTMPFFAALYGLAVTVIRSIPPHLAFFGDAIEFVASLFYVLSIASFVLAFVYLWIAAMPRYFETPAKSFEIRDHAVALSNWYLSTKAVEKAIDAKVTGDLRRLFVNQVSNATEANRPGVEKRLAARSRTILLLLAGFAFISASEMLMFVTSSFGTIGVSAHATSKPAAGQSVGNNAGAPGTAQGHSSAPRR